MNEHPEAAEVMKASNLRTIRDFEKIIVPMHGFKDVHEYYEYVRPARIIPRRGLATVGS